MEDEKMLYLQIVMMDLWFKTHLLEPQMKALFFHSLLVMPKFSILLYILTDSILYVPSLPSLTVCSSHMPAVASSAA